MRGETENSVCKKERMLQILHEDNHIIVVVKPQNIPSQGDSSGDKDMLTMVKEYLKESYNKPGNVYCGLVHRLDRPTGGVMVFAKTSKAAERLSEAIRTGAFEKRYYAVTVGIPKEATDTLRDYLVKNTQENMVKVCNKTAEGAKYAELSYNTLVTAPRVALLEVKLATGRSHQIRVQLANIGTPIFGDVRYGGDTLAKGHHLALWAYELKFVHPVTKVIMSFRACPPVDAVPWSSFKTLEAIFNRVTANSDCVKIALPNAENDDERAKSKKVKN